MIFEHIPGKALQKNWPFVRQGLERIREKGAWPWLAEDVYCALRTGRAALHYGKEGPRVVGFFIVETMEEAHSFAPILNVWCLYAAPCGEQNFAGAFAFEDACIAELDRIARAVNITRIQLSGRRGWERPLRGKFDVLRVTYERILPAL